MSDTDKGKGCAILLYIIWLVAIIWYFVDEKMRKNKFATYHAKQSIVLAITAIIIAFAGSIIPFLGWFIILPFGMLFVFVLDIIGLIYALTGKKKPLPIIGQFADKIHL